MSYTYIEAPNYVELPKNQPSIFLGGGISGVEDWQAKACRVLEGFGNITVVNPRRKDFNMNGGDALTTEQIKWEHHYLDRVRQVLFWFSDETIQPIVLFELGARLREYKHRPIGEKQPMFIGYKENYSRKMDVYHQARLEGYAEEFPHTLDELLKNVLDFNRLYNLLHSLR